MALDKKIEEKNKMKKTSDKFYKIINEQNKSCHGGNFDWTDYLPKHGEAGKWTPEITDIEECRNGYHITKYWNMWYVGGCKIFEVNAKGIKNSEGVVDKAVAESIQLVREVNVDFTGNCNTGDYNTGYRNTGDCNTGSYNTGDCNTGGYNTGDCNTGNCNAGYRNAGNYNAGNRNAGTRNTGDCNAGILNAGNRNAGYRNTGNYNTGDCNTGNYNAGDLNCGFFNTGRPKYIECFNKPIPFEVFEKTSFPLWINVETPSHECFRKYFEKASQGDVAMTLKLPNFDYEIFEEITGISKKDFDKKLNKTLT